MSMGIGKANRIKSGLSLFILLLQSSLLFGLLVPWLITVNLIRTARAEAVAKKGL